MIRRDHDTFTMAELNLIVPCWRVQSMWVAFLFWTCLNPLGNSLKLTPCTNTLTPLTLKVYALVRMEHRDQEFLGVCATCLHLSSSEVQISWVYHGLSGFLLLYVYLYIYTVYSLYIFLFASCNGQCFARPFASRRMRRNWWRWRFWTFCASKFPPNPPRPAMGCYQRVGGQRLQLKRLHMGIQHWSVLKPLCINWNVWTVIVKRCG